MSEGRNLPSVESFGASALRRAKTVETLEAAFAAWDEVRHEQKERAAFWSAERARLEERSRFVLGSLRAAGAGEPMVATGTAAEDALAVEPELSRMMAQAEAELSGRREALEKQAAAEMETLARTCDALRDEVFARIARYAQRLRPAVRLWVRPAGKGFRIVHLERLSTDEGVLLFHLLTGKIPSRWGFLEDEATDDLQLAPPSFYADEGLTEADTRPAPDRLVERLERTDRVLPARGFLPIAVPEPDGRRWMRFLRRGPVLELERPVIPGADGSEPASEARFEPRVPEEVAERVAGVLLRLKLSGRIDLEIETD